MLAEELQHASQAWSLPELPSDVSRLSPPFRLYDADAIRAVMTRWCLTPMGVRYEVEGPTGYDNLFSGVVLRKSVWAVPVPRC
jgi:hypothetical protein